MNKKNKISFRFNKKIKEHSKEGDPPYEEDREDFHTDEEAENPQS